MLEIVDIGECSTRPVPQVVNDSLEGEREWNCPGQMCLSEFGKILGDIESNDSAVQ